MMIVQVLIFATAGLHHMTVYNGGEERSGLGIYERNQLTLFSAW
jgi:hypothetical protein